MVWKTTRSIPMVSYTHTHTHTHTHCHTHPHSHTQLECCGVRNSLEWADNFWVVTPRFVPDSCCVLEDEAEREGCGIDIFREQLPQLYSRVRERTCLSVCLSIRVVIMRLIPSLHSIAEWRRDNHYDISWDDVELGLYRGATMECNDISVRTNMDCDHQQASCGNIVLCYHCQTQYALCVL